MSSHEIDVLIREFGCLLVFVVVGLQALGLPLPGTTALAAAAMYAAAAHGLPIAGVIAAGALGGLLGTTAGFALGRWRGERLLLWIGHRLRQSPERVHRLRSEFAAHGGSWLFVGRFISGVRNLTGLLAGASGMPLRRFLPISAAVMAVWAVVHGLGYYWFGRALSEADTWVQVVMVCAGFVWLLLSWSLLRRRAVASLQADRP